MCRLVLMNKCGEKEIEKNYGLSNFLKFLEEQMGGHGNGYALMRKGRITELNKGVKLSVKEISRVIRKSDYDWCIFHTRLASVGEKSDNNCHPFRRNTEVMAMNGTERSVDLVSKVKEITDTEAILDLKTTYKWGLPALKHLNSIFIGFSKGKPYIVANNIYNIKLLNNQKNNAIVFASDFPEKIKNNIYEPIEEFIWNDGPIDMKQFIKHKKKKKEKYFQTTIPFYDRYYKKSSFEYPKGIEKDFKDFCEEYGCTNEDEYEELHLYYYGLTPEEMRGDSNVA